MFLERQISDIMISEDHVTEDWSNDAENTALITEIINILQYIHIETAILNCNNICFFIKQI